jgi:ankyrin repeat protein
VDIIKLLIVNGANVDLKDSRGETALASAARRQTPELISAMRDAGAK